jgi:hypothetical protein
MGLCWEDVVNIGLPLNYVFVYWRNEIDLKAYREAQDFGSIPSNKTFQITYQTERFWIPQSEEY